MQTITVRGITARPILICYRLRADVLDARLPKNAHPRAVSGYAIGGIFVASCPASGGLLWPAQLTGLQHVVHFLNVTRQDPEGSGDELYVVRRDTSSRLHVLIGQCRSVRPHHAEFHVADRDDETVDLQVNSDDRAMQVSVKGRLTSKQPSRSVFSTVAQATEHLHQAVSLLDKSRKDRGKGHGRRWRLQPLEIERIESSIFEAGDTFPRGSVTFDSAYSVQEFEFVWASPSTVRTGKARTSLTFLQS